MKDTFEIKLSTLETINHVLLTILISALTTLIVLKFSN